MPQVTELLKSVPIFSDLDQHSLDELAGKCRRLTFNRHAVLMTEGETGETMYVIETGSAKVYVSDKNGDEMVLYIKEPGDYIGDIALLDDAPRSASVSTLEKTVVYCISKADFLATLRQNPEISIEIIRSLTRRLRHETDSVRSLALENVYRRLVNKLEELSIETEDGTRIMQRKFSHQELSRMIGSSREMVTKILSELTKGQYIELRDNRLVICKDLPHDF